MSEIDPSAPAPTPTPTVPPAEQPVADTIDSLIAEGKALAERHAAELLAHLEKLAAHFAATKLPADVAALVVQAIEHLV